MDTCQYKHYTHPIENTYLGDIEHIIINIYIGDREHIYKSMDTCQHKHYTRPNIASRKRDIHYPRQQWYHKNPNLYIYMREHVNTRMRTTLLPASPPAVVS